MKSAVLVFLSVMSLCGCATVPRPPAPSEKKETVFIDSMQEVQIGRSMSERIIKKKYPPMRDASKQLYVNKVGNRIVQACDRRDIVYHFMILEDPDLNAFALPGGYVYIFSGLFDRLDEAELAALLAHEVAHVAARNSVEKMQSALGVDLLAALALAGLGGDNPEFAQEIAGVSDTVASLLTLGYGRADELLADKRAVQYLGRAGVDPYSLVRALEVLKKETGPSGRVFETLSTRARMEERIKKIKQEIRGL